MYLRSLGLFDHMAPDIKDTIDKEPENGVLVLALKDLF